MEKEVFVINTGKTKGTTFKIKVKDHVFSSLFNTGAHVSCIKYDTVTEMGLLHQIPDSSTCIRTANGQDVGVKELVLVSFKIGSCSFTHKFIVCKGITRPFILGEDFLSCHCFKLGWTDNNKRFAEYKGKVIAIASQAVMDYRIMVSRAVWIPAQHFAMVPTKCPNMFSGRVEACPCHEFQNKFPNLYLEPMQYNNPDGKWSEDIPYMIINLEHDKDIYLGKHTVVAYAREEDKSCNYLEINEIIELADLNKEFSTKVRALSIQCFLQLKSQNTNVWS